MFVCYYPLHMADYLTAAQLSEKLNISEATLSRWRAAEPLQGPPFVRIEGTIRYPAEAVKQWLDLRTLGGALPAHANDTNA